MNTQTTRLTNEQRFPPFNSLLGKTLAHIERDPPTNQRANDGFEPFPLVALRTSDGAHYVMYHDQNCCEHVYLEDVAGDLDDLIGEPLLVAEESSNRDDPPKHRPVESYTWTFYKLATRRGSVTLRFYGQSNGYYSERVTLERLA